ncbi:oxygenase MpaB family protein [Planosporangium sp. 12N6]|uniref:oxygenase MpaB family protein n=1 Tax=Planosporangium spinosum TaxID=3402278 RepID=UPI003CEF1098
MGRYYWADRIARLDPDTDSQEIYRILVTYEFPWDMNQSLSLALYRTYAVPRIGRLLYDTGEFTARTQKRYDDTVLILDAILEHGLGSEGGRSALRRMNQMHGRYDISNSDMRYVLSTFVVVPIRWLDAFGWRRLTEKERVASANYYRELGRHMGIKDIPATHQAFAELLDDYEREHFAFDERARAVSDATLRLMATFPPHHRLPEAAARRLALAIMDDPLLEAFGYRKPTRVERALARGAIRLRGRVVRFLPSRTRPFRARDLPYIRSYPDGYDVTRLGTFAPGCPVPDRTRRPPGTGGKTPPGEGSSVAGGVAGGRRRAGSAVPPAASGRRVQGED